MDIDERLGSDGHVYRAVRHGVDYAIKTFPKVYREDKKKAIRKECDLIKMCSHSNVIRVVELFQVSSAPSTFYLVIEPWVQPASMI